MQARNSGSRSDVWQGMHPCLSSTHMSIKEIASKVMSILGLQREMF
jgi:regulator of PEP synthase PpsR (kinase-PPPase family)